ncbi:adenylate/guanylate cyclase domain-containing protein [Neolewinella sp.]|uniref:adenylate/guanylate cyclase domain-containing protein n=1 Tax=Neolewinella sp. TaxID=2993543 RepID=UPI003B52A03C
MYRLAYLFLFVVLAPALPAQTRYDGQIAAIERMLQQGKYATAGAQSEALIQEGQQQQLPKVEAYGNYLRGRALLENPSSTANQRIAGVRALRIASAGFSEVGLTAAADSVAARLRQIAGADSLGVVSELPTLRSFGRPRRQNEEALDQTALGAIVALQNQEIEALTDTQLRQLLRIQQQDMSIDSFRFQALNDSFALMQQDMLLEEQRALTQEERQRRNFFIVLALGVLVALALLYLRYRSSQRFQALLREKNRRIQEEQKRSNDLLLNILPHSVAKELKDSGKARARRFAGATVFFSDFVAFSEIAARTEPEELVRMLDDTFRAFDEITERHGLEKIKTIGDAYMCVCGVPEPDPDHAVKTVRAALEIQRYLEREGEFTARIGIHSGEVVAGVVGQKKFAYDIWGDTVNQAARLEAAGAPGEVTISQATCNLLGEHFFCEHIGTFEAKNIGVMDRYRVHEKQLV